MYLLDFSRKMAQLSIFIVTLINLVDSRNCSRMIREIQSVTNVEDIDDIVEDKDFDRSLKYIFPGNDFFCVSISGDMSIFHERIAAASQQFSQAFVMSKGKNTLRCNATIVAVEDVEGLCTTITTQTFSRSSRFYYLVHNSTFGVLERIFKDNTSFFREAEVAITCFKQFKQVLQIRPPMQGVKLMNIPAIGYWHKTDINLKNRKEIKFTTGNCDFHAVSRFNGSHYKFEGLEWLIFNAIARRMGLRKKFVFTTDYMYMGEFNETWSGGMLGSIVDNAVDVGFCSFWVEWRKFSPGLEVSEPYQRVCVTYMVPRPKVATYSTVGSFSPTVSILTIITIVISSTTMNYLTLSTKYCASGTDEGYRSWTYCLMVAWGIFTQGNYPAQSKELGAMRRMVFILAMYSLLMTSSFSSQLISNFFSPSYTSKPKNLKDLVDFGYSDPYIGQPPYPWSGVLDMNDPYARKWIQRSQPVPNFESLVHRLRTEPKQSFIGSVYKGIFIPYVPKPIPRDVMSKYEVMDSCVGEVYEAFAFQQGSPFLQKFNWYLGIFKQHGLIKREVRRSLAVLSYRLPAFREVMIKSESVHVLKPLTVYQLATVFEVLIFGLVIALVVFFGEIYHHRTVAVKIPQY